MVDVADLRAPGGNFKVKTEEVVLEVSMTSLVSEVPVIQPCVKEVELR